MPGSGIQHLLREQAPAVLGIVARRCGDFGAAEEAVQEALLAAALQWEREGIPDSPRAWLISVALRRLNDYLRSEVARRRREALVVSLIPAEEQVAAAPDEGPAQEREDALELLFLCCHPALSPPSAVALTLRAVGGLTTAEIARAFLVPEATMAQRIARAKQTLREASRGTGVVFEPLTEADRQARLGAVLHILYLIFNEGYAASAGDAVHRPDLAHEALRVTRLLHAAAPAEPEVSGLLALMLLTDARRAARTGSQGELVPLDEQDRSVWDRAAVAEGLAVLDEAWARGPVGPYRVQAAIAALHDQAASAAATDWPQIAALYGLLLQMEDNPMVALSHAIAVAMAEGPHVGLQRIDALVAEGRLRDHHRVHAARGHLLERAGDPERAAAELLRAAALTTSGAEREYLVARAARVRTRRV